MYLQEDKHKYASTQVDLPELGSKVDKWVARNIKSSWFHPTEEVGDDPHVTILYGLTSDNPGQVKPIAKKFGKKITIVLDKLDYFEAPEWDVLYISVSSNDLVQLNKAIALLPNKSKFTSYTPHITLAYLKKGQAKRFKGLKPFKEVFTKKGFMFSNTEGQKEYIPTVERSLLFGEVPKRDLL